MPTKPTNPREPSAGSLRPQVLPLVPGFTLPPGERRPLPDAGAVRRLVVPDSAPPYDDEVTTAHQGLALPPAPAAAPTGQRPVLPGQRPAPPGPHPAPPGPRPAPPGPPQTGHAAARGWPGQFAQVLAETLAGSRPSQQIVPWTTGQARKRIRQLGPMLSAGERPLVRRVVASQPAADVVEMTVIVRFGTRIRALAVRLERDGPQLQSPGRDARPQRWRCTAVEAA